MEEEINNRELIITPETPEPIQEQPKKGETKMSETDLRNMSIEELEAELKRRKEEEAKPKFVLDENDPSNLAKFLQTDELLPLSQMLNTYALDKAIAKYPGKLTKFAYLKDGDRKPTTDKEKVKYIHIVSVDGEYVVDEEVNICSFDAFPIILAKV